jgi:hypothetical protein
LRHCRDVLDYVGFEIAALEIRFHVAATQVRSRREVAVRKRTRSSCAGLCTQI